MSPADIQATQQKQVNEVGQILGLPPESTAILLRHTRWNQEKLIDVFMDNSEDLLDEAGLGPESGKTPKTEALPGFTCEICFEDGPALLSYAMICGHRYCLECYNHYLTQKVKEEGEAARIQCPREGCHRIVDSKSLHLVVSSKVWER